MLEIVDFYKVLQVDPEAEPEVVQAAFRSLARKYHPDVASGSEERMVAINNAWAVLGDPAERTAYDRGRGVVRSQPARQAPAPAPDPAPGAGSNGGHGANGARDSNGANGADVPPAGKPPGPAAGTVLNFGRYAGWSFGQIARHDPDFLEWFARMPIGRPFQTEIESLLIQLPRFQTDPARPPSPKRGFMGR